MGESGGVTVWCYGLEGLEIGRDWLEISVGWFFGVFCVRGFVVVR